MASIGSGINGVGMTNMDVVVVTERWRASIMAWRGHGNNQRRQTAKA